MQIKDQSAEELLSKEWLLTNSRGGYASGTVLGCNTRRYHGLLTGSLNPPVNRIAGLSNCLDTIIYNKKQVHLSSFEFDNRFFPEGLRYLRRFGADVGVHFDYKLDGLEMTKSIYLAPETDIVAIEYDFTSVDYPIEFVIRPFIALRDFHSLQKSYAHLYSVRCDQSLLIRHNVPHSCELLLRAESMCFEDDSQWWFNFLYRSEKQRGQDCLEDLWTPGFFKARIDEPRKLVLWASIGDGNTSDERSQPGIEQLYEDLLTNQNRLLKTADKPDDNLRKLYLAAGQFIAKRQIIGKKQTTTILAGFPWFADWGRDTFIALPGLLIATNRLKEAEAVLTTFADAADEGMIPNRFDDYTNTAHYNSIDASLWFIHACFQYYSTVGESKTFTEKLLPTIRWIIDCYHDGTRFGIHADADGLITGGNSETQLTWMDTKFDDVVFTPRYGKAVEINALWYNALCSLAEFFRDTDSRAAEHYGFMAEEVGGNFCKLFWNDFAGCLYDCIRPDGSIDSTLRPNQIFAVSLPFSPLSSEQQKQVVEIVQKNLLTPYGLRSLSPADSRYRGQYTGGQQQRDEAYHRGTVWPYLIGPFTEAYLRVNKFSKESKIQIREFIRPLMEHLTEDGCIGSISEIFDGDEPHNPKGCTAQAWSVAELIRAYLLSL